MKLKLLIMVLSAVLFACGSDAPVNEQSQQNQLERTLSAQKDALEKSKQLEREILNAAEKRRKAMEEKGG